MINLHTKFEMHNFTHSKDAKNNPKLHLGVGLHHSRLSTMSQSDTARMTSYSPSVETVSHDLMNYCSKIANILGIRKSSYALVT